MLEAALSLLMPVQQVRTIDWALANATTEFGQPYNHFAYPHLSAPGGPFDAVDSGLYRDLWLQWGSRLGKTFGGQVSMLKRVDCEPCPMMFASSTEDLGVGVVARTYGMLDHCERLRGQLPPPSRRKQNRIDFTFCRAYVAWSRSVSTLADKPVRFGHANEIDKWEQASTSKEADPLKLFDDRFKEFPTFIRWKEGTPAQKHSSRIERGRLGSCNAAYWVPCPHCRRYQVLKMDRLVWDKNEAGKSDKDLARRTARYNCGHCDKAILDEHRGSMMRAGVWVPEGCGCDDAQAMAAAAEWNQLGRPSWGGWKESSWITGTPMRDGQDYGSHLSSLYALARTWGDVAAEWVDVQKNPQNLRNFINQWLAETWEIVNRRETWETVAKRLIDHEIKRGILPKWASMVTIGIDRQGQYGEGRHPWVADAWGPGKRCATIAYGQAESLEEAERDVARMLWQHADGGPAVKPAMVIIDAGNRPLGVYECCERLRAAGIPSLPCKGSNVALNSDYELVTLGKNSAREGASLLHVDTIRSQIWVDRAIHDVDPAADGGFAIYGGSVWEHEDFIQQLLNDAPVEKTDKHNNSRESWDRINPGIPNDYRDCKRYSYTGMLLATRHGPIQSRRYTQPPEAAAPPSRIRELRIRR